METSKKFNQTKTLKVLETFKFNEYEKNHLITNKKHHAYETSHQKHKTKLQNPEISSESSCLKVIEL